MKYRVVGSLDFDLIVESDDEEQAFIEASDTAISGGGDGSYAVEEIVDDRSE